MIWFACPQCRKVHQRGEDSAGTYIFCACGQGLTVPWDSTVAPEETVDVPAVGAPAGPPDPPRLAPIPIGEERVPPRPRTHEEPPPLERRRSRSDRPGSGHRRRAPRRQRDPRWCFNHEERASDTSCSACGETFCGDCMVQVQGKSLCGPCKNFRVRLLHKPPRVSGMAVTAVILAMLSAPLGLCVWFLAVVIAAPIVNLLSLLPEVFALLLGVASLRDTEKNPRVSGRSLALTAVVTSLVAGVVSILLTLFGGRLGA